MIPVIRLQTRSSTKTTQFTRNRSGIQDQPLQTVAKRPAHLNAHIQIEFFHLTNRQCITLTQPDRRRSTTQQGHESHDRDSPSAPCPPCLHTSSLVEQGSEIMCCLAQPVDSVSRTRIFGRLTQQKTQFVAYQMRYASKLTNAMILPVPIQTRAKKAPFASSTFQHIQSSSVILNEASQSQNR